MPTQTMETSPARKALEIIRPDLAVAVPMTALAGFPIRRGDVVGRTASGKARPQTAAYVTSGFTTGSPSGDVDNTDVFKIGESLFNDATNQLIGVIQSMVGQTITLTANAAYAVPAGSYVSVKNGDGAPRAVGIADEASDGVGDTPIRVLIAGYIDSSLTFNLGTKARSDMNGVTLDNGIFKF